MDNAAEIVKAPPVDNLPAEPEKVDTRLQLAEKISQGKIEVRGGLEKWELNAAQEAYVVEWLKNGGNGTKAAMIAWPEMNETSATRHAFHCSTNPKIAGAIKELLWLHVATPDYVGGKLLQLSQNAKSEQVQHAATATLGKVWRMLSDNDGQQAGNVGLSVAFTLPARSVRGVVEPVDAEFTERPAE